MKKKFICTVCGYIYEGTEAPEKCPICKAPASKFKEMEDAVDDDMTFATVHVLGQAYKDSVNEDVIKGLKDHFNGECGEVGMYLAMARQADREGYPEIAEAYKRYAYEEADHASRFAELLGEVLGDTKSNLEARIAAEKGACEEKGEEFFHIGTSRLYFQVAPGAQQIRRKRTLCHDCCALSRFINGRKWNSSYDTLYTPAVNLCNDFVKKAPGFVPGAENQIKECSDVLLSPEPPGGDHSNARESRPCAR